MSILFPRALVCGNGSRSQHPVFRLLNDFEEYSVEAKRTRTSQHSKSFTPKFDVREVENVYELYGEVPGIKQEDILIEFMDEQTLKISGRSERSYSSGNAELVAPKIPSAANGGTETEHKANQASVEDDQDEMLSEAFTEPSTPSTPPVTESAPVENAPTAEKFWISERRLGQFSRSFNFPVRIDQDQVKASMQNGVLSVTAPKAKKAETRKIIIS